MKFNKTGDPSGVERLGVALEPEADYERRSDGGGGCEDPRVTFVEPLKRYIMTYTAFSRHGAKNRDRRIRGPLPLEASRARHLRSLARIELCNVDDKDASLFPVAIPNSAGQLELGMLHRPLFPGTRPEETACHHESVKWTSIMRVFGFPIALPR